MVNCSTFPVQFWLFDQSIHCKTNIKQISEFKLEGSKKNFIFCLNFIFRKWDIFVKNLYNILKYFLNKNLNGKSNFILVITCLVYLVLWHSGKSLKNNGRKFKNNVSCAYLYKSNSGRMSILTRNPNLKKIIIFGLKTGKMVFDSQL